MPGHTRSWSGRVPPASQKLFGRVFVHTDVQTTLSMKTTFTPIPLLVLAIWASASSTVLAQLVPVATDGHMEVGREYIPLSSDSIDVELGFDGMHDDRYVFDFVVVNRTTDTLTIRPTEFYYVLLDSATADSSRLPPRMAYHPERIIHHYRKSIEEGYDDQELHALIGLIDAGIGLLAHTTALIVTEDPGHIVDAVFNTIGTAGYYLEQDLQIGRQIHSIEEEKEVVEQEILRNSELPPGKVLSGFVFFPGHREPGCLMFCFPFEDQLFQFVYEQYPGASR